MNVVSPTPETIIQFVFEVSHNFRRSFVFSISSSTISLRSARDFFFRLLSFVSRYVWTPATHAVTLRCVRYQHLSARNLSERSSTHVEAKFVDAAFFIPFRRLKAASISGKRSRSM